MVLWLFVLALGGPVVGATLLAYLYECFPEISSWCTAPLGGSRWLRSLVLWLFGLAVWIRSMSVMGCAILIRFCRWLEGRIPPVKLFTWPIALLFYLCAILLSSRVGVGNDEIATKEWILDEVCHLSRLEFFRLADRLKKFSAAQFGAYD